MSLARFAFLLLLLAIKAESGPQPPHIIFVYADDLGWNDVSFHGSPQIPTPNIDALAMNGVLLNNYYGEYMCTPSRAALLTGKYPMRLGLQHYILLASERKGLPIEEKLLPQHLKDLGYSTHMIGKWHLGYHKYEYMPSRRGFDTFFGYMNGYVGYYDYVFTARTNLHQQPWFSGIDLYNNTTPVKDFRGQYATHVFTEKAEDIISRHDVSKPLFLYLSHLAVHTSNFPQFHEAPPEITEKFKHVSDLERRLHAATMSAMDDSVGVVFKALHKKGMLDNCVFLFVSDNGAEAHAEFGGKGSNYPLRGMKQTHWEGAVRVPAVMWSPLLNVEKSRVSQQMMHVTDWLPTLYSAAGGNAKDLGKIDGHNLWPALVNATTSPRLDMLNVLDPVYGISAYRKGDLKLVNGSYHKELNSWYGPSGFEGSSPPASMYQWVFKNGSDVGDVLKEKDWWICKDPDQFYRQARVTCERPLPRDVNRCDPSSKPCLFNITADPCEYHDLSKIHCHTVKEMMTVIQKYSSESVQPHIKISDPNGDPRCHNFTYVPWMEPEYFVQCTYAD